MDVTLVPELKSMDPGIYSHEQTTHLFNATVRNISTGVYEHKCAWNAMNSGLACLLFITFLLNVLSSVVLFRVPLVTVRGRSNPVYLCIRFLNVCDVLQAFFLIVMPVFATPDCGWLGGQLSCSIMGFIVLFFLLVSPLITILMAFDRVIALYKPFKYRSHLGLKMLKMLLPSACILVFITTILPIFGVGQYHVVKGRRFCLLDTITENSLHRSYVIGVHSVFFLSLLFMLSCTITFQVKLVRMSFTKKHQESKSRKKLSSKRTRNATLTTMAVCCIFIICYLPYVVRVLVEASTLRKSPSWITWITFGLAFLQPLLNPIVYVGTNVRYRQELQSMLKNISATDIETSSESGATHAVSRGGFSGFRRRLSSGGSRNSKRGSNKRKNFGSHTSINGPAFNEPQDFAKNGFSRGSRKAPASTNHQRKNTHLKEPRSPELNLGSCDESDHKIRGEPSSSSGVKSFDSMDKILLTPPVISSNYFGSKAWFFANEPARYGRGIRLDDDVTPETRERSNTVSGDKSPIHINSKRSSLADNQSHCASVPTLLDQKSFSRISMERKNCPDDVLNRGEGFLKKAKYGCTTRSEPLSDKMAENGSCSRRYGSHSNLNRCSERLNIADKRSDDGEKKFAIPEVCVNSSTGKDKQACENCEETHLLQNKNGIQDTARQTDGLQTCGSKKPTGRDGPKRLEGRSSYKKAVEMSSDFITRKPSKRDSGVGDP